MAKLTVPRYFQEKIVQRFVLKTRSAHGEGGPTFLQEDGAIRLVGISDPQARRQQYIAHERQKDRRYWMEIGAHESSFFRGGSTVRTQSWSGSLERKNPWYSPAMGRRK